MLALVSRSIGRRLYTLLALFAIGFAGIVAYQLIDLRKNLEHFKQLEIQSVVQSAVSIAQNYYDRAQAGEFSMEEAQKRAEDTIRATRYQGEEYLFVDDFNYVNIVHGLTPKTEGQQREGLKDSSGKLYVKERIDGARAAGAGYFDYYWLSPNGQNLRKTSYAEVFKPWDWVIATGVLLDNVDAAFYSSAAVSGSITLAITLLMLLLGVLIVRGISRPLASLNSNMLELADNRFDIEIAGTNRRDELGGMARAIEVFRENGLKVAQMTEAEATRIIRDQAERSRMMGDLQQAFGNVVEAATAGDFTQRVRADFADAELNVLARGVNSLVETVDGGIGETGKVLSALADTDLTLRMEGQYQGAFARLKADTNAVAEKLTDIMGQLRGTSGTLKTATSEILSGANDLSERTTKQAATIEETSAAMEQLAGTVTENARKAEGANRNAVEVARTAEDGQQVMSQATEAMERITSSSARISNIIGMIDDIAFQTNLLALNASVEAARAGEAGAGFAVVAVEVRRLAQSSAQASAEIKALIQESAHEVDGGSRLVASAAGKLAEMLEALRSNNTMLESIADASREQAASINEVTSAIRQMDEMTQHNAALVEEINAAIEKTEAQATDLDHIVDVFRIDSHSAPAARPTPASGAGNARRYLSQGNAALKDEWSEF